MSVVLHDGVRAFTADEQIVPKRRRAPAERDPRPAVIVLAASQRGLPPWLDSEELPRPKPQPPQLAEWGIWWATITAY